MDLEAGIRPDLWYRERKNKPTFFASELEQLPHVVAFSGGRTSGYMLRQILDQGVKPIVLFANTGKEDDRTLDFVREVEVRWDVAVTWLEYTRVPADSLDPSIWPTKRRQDYVRKQAQAGEHTHWFKVVNHETAARLNDDRTPFDELLEWMSVLPNPRVRACTSQLKIMTMLRYLWSIGIKSFINHIGMRADEPDRAYDMVGSKDRIWDVLFSFPLLDGVTRKDVNEYWRNSSFDLQLESYEGNCKLCFLKKRAKKIRLIRETPGLAEWWKSWEQRKKSEGVGKNGSLFRAERGHAYAVLEAFAAFPDACDAEDIDFADDDDEAMECSCTSGAMNVSESEI